MGNVPTTTATNSTIDAINDEDPGVVALLRVASQRESNTEEERKELSKMAKRLRKTKKKLLEKQHANGMASSSFDDNHSTKEGHRYEPTVDDFREFAVDKDIDDGSSISSAESS